MLAWLAIGSGAGVFARTEIGRLLENVEMPTLDGGTHPLFATTAANVFVFFRPSQEHSRVTLKQLARLEKENAGKPLHWVAIISDSVPRAEAEIAVKEAGLTIPVLIDVGDVLYGKLGVELHPVIGLVDKDRMLVAYLPFTKVNYAETIRAHIRYLLKEITNQELAVAIKPSPALCETDAVTAHRRLLLAKKLFEAKQFADAVASAHKSVDLDPTNADAPVLLGRILAAQGKCEAALKFFEQALKLDPSNLIALAGKKDCEDLLSHRPSS